MNTPRELTGYIVSQDQILLKTTNNRVNSQSATLGAVFKGRPANREGGAFEISDVPGRGWFVKISCIQDTLSSRARVQPLGRMRARAKVSCIQEYIKIPIWECSDITSAAT